MSRPAPDPTLPSPTSEATSPAAPPERPDTSGSPPEGPRQPPEASKRGAWSMRRRLARTYALVGAGILILALLAIGTLVRTTDRLSQLVDHVSPAAVTAGHLETAYVDQETGVQGYALAKKGDFLYPYTNGRHHEALEVAKLHRLLHGQPDLLADLRPVQAAAATWHREVALPTITRTRAGQQVTPGDLERGKARFNAIRASLGVLQSDLQRERNNARNHLRRAVTVLDIVVGLALLGVVLLGVGLWQAQRLWVLAPVATVGAEVRRVASGDLGHEIGVTGPRELRELAHDVDVMRQTIVALYRQAVGAQDEISAQARLLGEQADELRRSNVELEQFAYVASHDLQEPLRKVASFCQLLQRRYQGQLDERADQYIAFAVDGAKRMQRLINDLLGFSRVGRATREFTDVDCNSVLRQALSNLEAGIEESGAEVTADPLPVVRGDQVLLAQVFQNLVGNAIKFRGDEPPRVHLSATRTDDEAVFSCSDNGIGIEPEYAERVFVIFQRLHSKEAYEGTGIGLSMCKKIIEYHGGRIWIDSARGRGTTVKWTLPTLGSTPAAAAAPGPPPTDPALPPAPPALVTDRTAGRQPPDPKEADQ